MELGPEPRPEPGAPSFRFSQLFPWPTAGRTQKEAEREGRQHIDCMREIKLAKEMGRNKEENSPALEKGGGEEGGGGLERGQWKSH